MTWKVNYDHDRLCEFLFTTVFVLSVGSLKLQPRREKQSVANPKKLAFFRVFLYLQKRNTLTVVSATAVSNTIVFCILETCYIQSGLILDRIAPKLLCRFRLHFFSTKGVVFSRVQTCQIKRRLILIRMALFF